MDLLTTREAAERLHVTPIRVRQMIREGKIEAKQVGRDYVIEASSLTAVKTYGKAGRPKGTNGKPTAKTEKPMQTAFDTAPDLMNHLLAKQRDLPSDLSTNKESTKSFAEVAAKYIGSIKEGLPTDLSTNKEYLKDLGKKSAEKKALLKRKELLKDD